MDDIEITTRSIHLSTEKFLALLGDALTHRELMHEGERLRDVGQIARGCGDGEYILTMTTEPDEHACAGA